MNMLLYLYLLHKNFFLRSNSIRLLPIKPRPPVTINFFIILFFTLVKTISIVHNLKIIIHTVCQYLGKIYQ